MLYIRRLSAPSLRLLKLFNLGPTFHRDNIIEAGPHLLHIIVRVVFTISQKVIPTIILV